MSIMIKIITIIQKEFVLMVVFVVGLVKRGIAVHKNSLGYQISHFARFIQ